MLAQTENNVMSVVSDLHASMQRPFPGCFGLFLQTNGQFLYAGGRTIVPETQAKWGILDFRPGTHFGLAAESGFIPIARALQNNLHRSRKTGSWDFVTGGIGSTELVLPLAGLPVPEHVQASPQFTKAAMSTLVACLSYWAGRPGNEDVASELAMSVPWRPGEVLLHYNQPMSCSKQDKDLEVIPVFGVPANLAWGITLSAIQDTENQGVNRTVMQELTKTLVQGSPVYAPISGKFLGMDQSTKPLPCLVFVAPSGLVYRVPVRHGFSPMLVKGEQVHHGELVGKDVPIVPLSWALDEHGRANIPWAQIPEITGMPTELYARIWLMRQAVVDEAGTAWFPWRLNQMALKSAEMLEDGSALHFHGHPVRWGFDVSMYFGTGIPNYLDDLETLVLSPHKIPTWDVPAIIYPGGLEFARVTPATLVPDVGQAKARVLRNTRFRERDLR